MKVELISHTHDALNLLLTTKGTRLAHNEDPSTWSAEKKQEHLEYMRDTIKSSWEFVDYTFRISGVTRAFTHQLVRTRTGSYAQEAMRVVDARDHAVTEPEHIMDSPLTLALWMSGIKTVMDTYSALIDEGVPPQDARGILPTNIQTSIIAKFNLRTLHESAKLRLCTRTQGEYQDVFRAMRAEVIKVHPWTEEFIQVHCVATGTCAFPRYGKKECPIYLPLMDNSEVKRMAKRLWDNVRYEASPVAKDGKAM
jgi:flavin-dependent thymidylate synthase